MNETQRLEQKIAELQQTLNFKKRELEEMHRRCRHQWGGLIYDPIITEPYTSPGDAPGTMGVDWRGPCHVPGSTTRRWTKTCTVCGKKIETTRTRQSSGSQGLQGEVPDFGSDM